MNQLSNQKDRPTSSPGYVPETFGINKILQYPTDKRSPNSKKQDFVLDGIHYANNRKLTHLVQDRYEKVNNGEPEPSATNYITNPQTERTKRGEKSVQFSSASKATELTLGKPTEPKAPFETDDQMIDGLFRQMKAKELDFRRELNGLLERESNFKNKFPVLPYEKIFHNYNRKQFLPMVNAQKFDYPVRLAPDVDQKLKHAAMRTTNSNLNPPSSIREYQNRRESGFGTTKGSSFGEFGSADRNLGSGSALAEWPTEGQSYQQGVLTDGRIYSGGNNSNGATPVKPTFKEIYEKSFRGTRGEQRGTPQSEPMKKRGISPMRLAQLSQSKNPRNDKSSEPGPKKVDLSVLTPTNFRAKSSTPAKRELILTPNSATNKRDKERPPRFINERNASGGQRNKDRPMNPNNGNNNVGNINNARNLPRFIDKHQHNRNWEDERPKSPEFSKAGRPQMILAIKESRESSEVSLASGNKSISKNRLDKKAAGSKDSGPLQDEIVEEPDNSTKTSKKASLANGFASVDDDGKDGSKSDIMKKRQRSKKLPSKQLGNNESYEKTLTSPLLDNDRNDSDIEEEEKSDIVSDIEPHFEPNTIVKIPHSKDRFIECTSLTRISQYNDDVSSISKQPSGLFNKDDNRSSEASQLRTSNDAKDKLFSEQSNDKFRNTSNFKLASEESGNSNMYSQSQEKLRNSSGPIDKKAKNLSTKGYDVSKEQMISEREEITEHSIEYANDDDEFYDIDSGREKQSPPKKDYIRIEKQEPPSFKKDTPSFKKQANEAKKEIPGFKKESPFVNKQTPVKNEPPKKKDSPKKKEESARKKSSEIEEDYAEEDFEALDETERKKEKKKFTEVKASVEKKVKKDPSKREDHIVRGTFNPDEYVDDDTQYLEELDDL